MHYLAPCAWMGACLRQLEGGVLESHIPARRVGEHEPGKLGLPQKTEAWNLEFARWYMHAYRPICIHACLYVCMYVCVYIQVESERASCYHE